MKRNPSTTVTGLLVGVAALAVALGGGCPAAQGLVGPPFTSSCDSAMSPCNWDRGTMEVSFSGVSDVALRFTPPTTGGFTITVSNKSGNLVLDALIADDTGTFLNDGNITVDGVLVLDEDLVGGKDYTLVIKHYEPEAAGVATVSFADAAPGVTFSTAIAWDLTPKIVQCVKGKGQRLKFVAPKPGSYTFTSQTPTKTTSPRAYLYDDQRTLLKQDSDRVGSNDFNLTETLVGGKTYYLYVGASPSLASAHVTVTAQGPGIVDPTAKVKAGKVTITGKKKVGAKLKAKLTKYEKGVKHSYTWLRNGKKIKGATKSSYTIKKADRGKRISVRVVTSKKGLTSVEVTSKPVKIPK